MATKNPYHPETDAHRLWQMGFDDAQAGKGLKGLALAYIQGHMAGRDQ